MSTLQDLFTKEDKLTVSQKHRLTCAKTISDNNNYANKNKEAMKNQIVEHSFWWNAKLQLPIPK